jgi:hypothetical protein
LIRLLSQRPNWANEFVSYVVTSGSNLNFANNVAHLLLNPSIRDDRALLETLMQRLVASGQFAAAWDIYQSPGLTPDGSAARTIRNGDFDTPEDRSPFDWNFSQAPELWSARERLPSANGSVLRLAAYNGSAGVVAQQLLHLRSGAHRLQIVFGDIPADRYERPQLQVECAQTRGVVLVGLSPMAYGAGPFTLSSQFTVPQDCSFQRISVLMAGQGAEHDPLPWIDDLRVD